MKVRLTGKTQNARGEFEAGDIVDWPEKTVRPLIDCGAAVPFIEAETDVLLATNVQNLDEMLALIADADVIRDAERKDHRVSAAPKYAARLAEIEPDEEDED